MGHALPWLNLVHNTLERNSYAESSVDAGSNTHSCTIERYNALEFNKERVKELIDMGCYTQINSSHVLKPKSICRCIQSL